MNYNNEIFEQFEERTKQIRSSLNKKTIDHIKNVYNKKLFCVAKLKSENEYFRAEIKDFKDETNEIRVFYVDFGDYSWDEDASAQEIGVTLGMDYCILNF